MSLAFRQHRRVLRPSPNGNRRVGFTLNSGRTLSSLEESAKCQKRTSDEQETEERAVVQTNCASGVAWQRASFRGDYHEIVTSLSARNAMNAEAMAASIAPPATTRAIVALRSADRAFSTTLRIASKPCAATTSARLNLI